MFLYYSTSAVMLAFKHSLSYIVDVYNSVYSGPPVQGELCLGPGEERLRHRRRHLLVQVGRQLCQQTLAKGCQCMSSVLKIYICT